jgi:hypothetical protein
VAGVELQQQREPKPRRAALARHQLPLPVEQRSVLHQLIQLDAHDPPDPPREKFHESPETEQTNTLLRCRRPSGRPADGNTREVPHPAADPELDRGDAPPELNEPHRPCTQPPGATPNRVSDPESQRPPELASARQHPTTSRLLKVSPTTIKPAPTSRN